MPSARLYPEPINTILEYSFYALCFLGRVWYKPPPATDIDDVKVWTREHYLNIRYKLAHHYDMDHKNFFAVDTFSSLMDSLNQSSNADKYEKLHGIRWMQADDMVAYATAKSLGFWSTLIRHVKANYERHGII